MELLQFYRKLPDDKIKTYKNMYRITVNICSEEGLTVLAPVYFDYGKYTYSPISSLIGSNRYWMKIGNGDYVQSGGI